MHQEFQYQSRKNDSIVKPIATLLNLGFRLYYTVSFEHMERLHHVKDKPFMLLPKHLHELDILLEGVIVFKAIKRCPHYIMKPSLAGYGFEYCGGIKITRISDLRGKDRGERKKALREAQQQKKYVDNVIKYLLQNGEIVVYHPEGTRTARGTENLQVVQHNLRKLLRLQKEMGKQITFVPLDIRYQNLRRYRSRIRVIVGNPFQVPDDGLEEFVERMHESIPTLF